MAYKWADKWRLELSPVLECSPRFEGLDKELVAAQQGRHVTEGLPRLAALAKLFFRSWLGRFSQSQLVLFLQALAEAGTCACSLRFVLAFWGISVKSILLQIQC